MSHTLDEGLKRTRRQVLNTPAGSQRWEIYMRDLSRRYPTSTAGYRVRQQTFAYADTLP